MSPIFIIVDPFIFMRASGDFNQCQKPMNKSICLQNWSLQHKYFNMEKYFLMVVSKWFSTILRVGITSYVIQTNDSGNVPIRMKI